MGNVVLFNYGFPINKWHQHRSKTTSLAFTTGPVLLASAYERHVWKVSVSRSLSSYELQYYCVSLDIVYSSVLALLYLTTKCNSS